MDKKTTLKINGFVRIIADDVTGAKLSELIDDFENSQLKEENVGIRKKMKKRKFV